MRQVVTEMLNVQLFHWYTADESLVYVHCIKGTMTGMCLMCELEQHVQRCYENSGSIVKPHSILQMLKGTFIHSLLVHCVLASCGAVYCNQSCLWVGVCVCGSVTTTTRNCKQTGFVGKGSDSRQLIKFRLSCAPGKGVCGGAKILGSTLLHPACSVCVSLSAFFTSFYRTSPCL